MTCRGGVIDHRFVGDPIDVITGAFIEDTKDFQVADAMPIVWRRLYSSSDIGIDRGLGVGHTHSFDHRLQIHLDGIGYTTPSGTIVEFPAFTNSSPRVSTRGYVLRRRDRELVVETPERLTVVFEMGAVAQARPIRVGDVRLGYDPITGRLISLSNAHGSIVVLTWDAAHIIAADGNRASDAAPTRLASYRYDANRLTDFQDAYGATMRYAHDAAGRIVARADRSGYKFGFRYDVEGRCIHSAAEDGVLEVKLEYFPLERRTTVTKSDGGVWEYFYDEVGTLITIIDGEGGTRTFVPRASDGQIESETDGAGNEYRYEYDADGSFVVKRDALRRVVRENSGHSIPSNPLEYELGRIAERPSELPARDVVGPWLSPTAQAQLTFARTPGAGRLTKVVDVQGLLIREEQDGRSRRYGYDAGGNSRWRIDFDGARQDFDIASFFQVRGERDANGHVTRFEYTTENELAAVVDAGGTRTTFAHDKRADLTGVARAGTLKERYHRDGAGRIIQKDGPGGLRYTVKRGPQGEVVERFFASGGFEQLGYDHRLRVVEGKALAGTSTFAYDGQDNRIIDELEGVGVRRRFRDGQLTEVTVLGRFRARYRAFEHQGTPGIEITDPTGARHRVHSKGAGIFVRESGARTETTQYHPNGRCLHRIVEGGSHTPWTRAFEYSPEGYLLARHDSQRGVSRYRHDAAHRVIAEDVAGSAPRTFEYDAAGNIIQNGATRASYFQGNVLAAANDKTFKHDASQALSTETSATRSRQFVRDERGQLIAVRNFARSAVPNAPWEEAAPWSAQYDILNRRVAKTHEGRTTRYVWNTDQLAAEIHSDGRVRIYVYADALALTPLLFVDYDSTDAAPASGTVYVVLANHLGCPERIERLDGSTVWSATLSAYGEATIEVGAEFHQPLRWPGHYFDSDLGLHYNRFRNYSPELGRYLEPDPIGRAGGLENVYAYTHNPLKYVDVDGLTCPKKAAEEAEAKKRADEALAEAEAEVKRLKDEKASAADLKEARRKRYEAECAAAVPPKEPKSYEEWSKIYDPTQRGKQDEGKALGELEMKDNNLGTPKTYDKLDKDLNPVKDSDGNVLKTRPDGSDDKLVVESKSVNAPTGDNEVVVCDTEQTRGQREGAKDDGKAHAVVISSNSDGENVRPSGPLAESKSNVLHRDNRTDPGTYSKWDKDSGSWKPLEGQSARDAALGKK